ncbi:ArdC family protein [Prosthecodimorpha staleyi]|uniref:DUF1738 domain-containing protein n=1 Tax=Prosthecodimorpha staleyi TaxID=2840188 RepID=A0A947DC08_9HYPH|nr:zincin-like metallopeptidase domain-containing protein [Prosthecodimorpha staleyi]MBT9293097.1 DUF1738 domain-containing protein [Prosthecodimorpha staleyi]
MSKERFDIHQAVTDRIVAAIEAGAGSWQMPWHRGAGGRRPVNIASGNAYQGVNILALWVEAQFFGYGSNVWGTYKQWAEAGCQVRKGAKAAHVVFYKQIAVATEDTDSGEDETETRLFARASPVFNAGQVEGYAPPVPPVVGSAEILAGIEAFVAGTGAAIEHGGSVACYIPSRDLVRMPPRETFFATPTSTATEAYYSTELHELVHWTGPKSRCDRDLAGRFRSEAYAMEELVAELGAAFLSADLGITAEPRADHAQYLAHWLTVLKADKKAIFTAASAASRAVQFLHGLQAA